MKTVEELKEITSGLLEGSDVFLVDLSVSRDNKIEIIVDAVSGVNIQKCIALSREFEKKLDREEEDFELTVSSAGIGYPFKVAGQYQKNIGNPVEVKLKDGTKLEGILKTFDGDSIVLEYEEKKQVEGKKKKEIVKAEKMLSLGEIKQIKDIVRF